MLVGLYDETRRIRNLCNNNAILAGWILFFFFFFFLTDLKTAERGPWISRKLLKTRNEGVTCRNIYNEQTFVNFPGVPL